MAKPVEMGNAAARGALPRYFPKNSVFCLADSNVSGWLTPGWQMAVLLERKKASEKAAEIESKSPG